MFVPNKFCSDCEGTKFDPQIHGQPRNPTLRQDLKYPRKLMYWEWSQGEYILDEEQWPMTLAYNPAVPLANNLHFELYEFFSIIRDTEDQRVDTLFGLGPVEPALLEEGQVSTIEWFFQTNLTDHKLVSIYLGVEDGRSDVNSKRSAKVLDLPEPHLQFGSFNLTNLAKKNNIHFFSTTSQYQWTLDFYGLQYAHDKFLDLKRDDNGLFWHQDWG